MTNEELQRTIAALATKEDLREEGERLRRHMDIVGEALRAEIRLLDQQLSVVMARLPDR
jgi:uncharacterized protein YicC (UPF0701 family)